MRKLHYLFLLLLCASSISFAQLKPVTYSDGTQILNGFSVQPKEMNQKKPGVLILPAWMGIDTHSKNTAENLSTLGYYAFVADIYGENNYPKNYSEAGQKAGYYKTNYLEYQKRITLALKQLILAGADPDNIVVIGYCFGGTGALESARGHLNLRGVVSFHGGLARDATRILEPITTPVLVCHGADDPYVSKEEIANFQQEMRTTKADWQMIYYANAVHSFTNPEAGNDNSKGAAYNQIASNRSWEQLKTFLIEVLKK
jgi:dienelactone hydrolase